MRPNLYDYLKIVAIVTMIIDHIWFFLYPDMEILRLIGRTAFPLFLFLVWWNHKYWFNSKLWFRWIILQVFVRYWYWQGYTEILYLNILLAIWLTRVLLSRINTQQNRLLEFIIFFLAFIYASQTQHLLDYWTISVIFWLLWYWVRDWWISFKSYLLIIFSVIFHLLFMLDFYWFHSSWWWLLILIWCLLVISMSWMSVKNYSMKVMPLLDSLILRLSRHSLEIYVTHVIIIVSLSFI